MPSPIVGLHHVTAIASNPQRNLDFYTETLGLRFVKRTINFDDPGSYHFYFGDDIGSPGTILTFFPWPRATRGLAGAGEVVRVAFSVPAASLDYWEQRLRSENILVERNARRFDEDSLTFADPDGMRLELVGHDESKPLHAPRYASVPAEHSIRGFFGVTLLEHSLEATASVLSTMGFKKIKEDGSVHRFAAEGDALGNHIDVMVDPKASYGRPGAGGVHHIAFRAQDDAAQLEWLDVLSDHLEVTPVQDRTYFHSIYYREPGGVLFEMATDPPGFLLDEPVETLGESLKLPPWMEQSRPVIEARLAPLTLRSSSEGKAGTV